MRVPSPTTGTTNLPRQPEGYLQAATPDLSGLTRGLSVLADGLADREAKKKSEADQLARFKATESFVEFNSTAQARVDEMKGSASPEDLNFAERAINSYMNYEDEFISTLPPDLQDEFRMRTAATRMGVTEDVTNFQKKNLQLYQKNSLTRMQDKANEDIDLNPDTMDGWKKTVDEAIDNSAYSNIEKHYMKLENARFLEARGYKQTVKRQRISDAEYSNDLVAATTQAAADLGISPVDLLTVISYETGGKFSTSIKGGAGGRHIGLIQFGIPEAKKYGVHANQTPGEQMKSVVAYLKDRGLKPGMNILDLYSTINAGSPGRYNASDANNGGAPGTVADKVRDQMAGHKARAIALLGGKYSIPDTIDEDPRFSNVPYEDRMNIRKDVETEINSHYAEMERLRKAEQNARMNDLFNRLQSGDVGRAEYDRMVEDGMIPDYDDRKKALGIIENRDKEGKDRRAGQDRLRLGTTFDLTDSEQKKQLNAVFGEEGVEYMQRRDEEYVANTLAPLFNQAGGLPSDALGILKAQAVSSNPADMMYALQTLSVLENINKPAYDAQIPKDLAAKSDFNELMETTLPLKDRIEMLTDAPTQEMRTRKKMLKEEANEMLANSADPEMAVGFATIVEELGAPPNSQVAQIAEAEWNALFVEAYSKYGGNRDAAIELATKQFNRVWKKSMQDGVEVFMKHPPEAYHAPIAGSNDWMREQVRNTLGLTEDETYMMVSDRQTQIEVDQAQMKGEKPSPSWTVAVQRANGLWDIAREADGKPMRMRLKPTTYDMKAQEMNLRVESKKIELQAVMELMAPYGMSIMGAPQEIQDRAANVRSELDALLMAKDNAIQDAVNAYKTPAAQEVERLQKKFDELQRIMYIEGKGRNYYKALKEFPQAAEYAKVIDDLEAAKAKAEIELKAKRKPLSNESVDIFLPPPGTAKNMLLDMFGLGEEEVPDNFDAVTKFARLRQTSKTDDINNIFDIRDRGISPSEFKAQVTHMLDKIPLDVLPEKGKKAFAEIVTKGRENPIARLGMKAIDPERIIMYNTEKQTNLGGTYSPNGDWIFFAANDPTAFVHELMHKGITEVIHKLPTEDREYLKSMMEDNMDGEEAVIRVWTNELYPGLEMTPLEKKMQESAEFFYRRNANGKLGDIAEKLMELAKAEKDK